jgi:hypothetical protein
MGETSSGPATFTRLGLSRTELEAAILAELEQSGDGLEPARIASAVAASIEANEANNEQVLRHLSQMLSPANTVSGSAVRARPTTPEAR